MYGTKKEEVVNGCPSGWRDEMNASTPEGTAASSAAVMTCIYQKLSKLNRLLCHFHCTVFELSKLFRALILVELMGL